MVQQLSGMDATFVYLDQSGASMMTGGVLLYDPSTAPGGTVTFEDVLANVSRRLHLAKAFRRKMVRVPFDLDHPYWIEDPAFDVEYHVRQLALPTPGDWRQLCTQAARIHARPLDLSRPLWELYVVEGVRSIPGVPENAFAMIFRMHHAAIDGVSGMELMAAIHDLEPDDQPADDDGSWHGEQGPSQVELLTRAGAHAVVRPWRALEWAGHLVPALRRRREVQSRVAVPQVRAPRTRFNSQITPHRTVGGVRVDLDEVKRIRKVVPGATVNDVVLTWVGGALRSYLDDLGELPTQSLVAATPISTRADAEVGTEGNLISGALTTLATDVEDPLARLEHIATFTAGSRERTNATGAKTLVAISEFLPGALFGVASRVNAQLAGSNRVPLGINTVVTNVPGPQVPLYSGGARLFDMYGLGPLFDGMGLINVVNSYCGGVVNSFTSCRELMPDPDVYEEALRASFSALSAASGGG